MRKQTTKFRDMKAGGSLGGSEFEKGSSKKKEKEDERVRQMKEKYRNRVRQERGYDKLLKENQEIAQFVRE